MKAFLTAIQCSAAVITVLAGQPALAQSDAAPPEADTAVPTDATDIIVTAQRRSERVQDIPASISAINAEAIKSAGILDISNVAPRVPGFYAGGFGSSRPQLYIRGIGTRQFDPGSESSVGVFVDESYLGRTGGVLGSLKDIERIEVLKGPQGTLYGRNTIGGAINVITKGPTSDFSAEAEAGFGNYNSYDLFAAVSGPIAGETLLGRITGWRSYRQGYVTNLTTGNHPQGMDNYGGRLRLQINPSENVKIDLIGELVRDTGRSFQGESVGSTVNPNGILLGAAGSIPLKSDDPYKQYYTTDPVYNRHIDALTGRVQFDFAPGSLVLVSSYRKMRYSDDRDFDNTNLNVIQQISAERSRQFTQEVRFVSAADGPLSFGGAVDWIIGGYYYDDKSFHSDTFRFGPNSVVYALTGANQVDTTVGDYRTKSYAAFGQATIHITPTVDLTLGGRYTHDEKSSVLSGTTTDARPLVSAPFSVTNPSKTFSSFDPKIVLSFKPNRDLNIYASFSQGFKSGGYQYTPLTATQAALVFEPESIDAYEIGVKSSLIDRTLTLNAALFRYDYSNIQVSRVVQLADGSTPSLITNAGKSRIKGFEIDATAHPTPELTFNLSYAYTDAKYLSYVASGALDFSGTRMVRAPRHSVNVSGEYQIPLPDDMSLTFRADYAVLSTFFHEPGQGELRFGSTIPLTREPGYGLGNARVTFAKGGWRLSAWMNNVFDTTYRRSVLALPGQVINIYGQPRTYGLTAGVTF